jgi:hypothetical protein
MASIIEAVEKALYSKLAADTGAGGLMTLVAWAGPEYAPSDAAYPLLTYALAEPPERANMIGARAWERFTYRLTAYTTQSAEGATDKGLAQAIIARVLTLLDRVALTVTGYTHIATVAARPYAERVTVYGGKAYVGVSVDMIIWVQ